MLNFILQISTAAVTGVDSLANSPAVTGIQSVPATNEITETKISLFKMVMNGGPILIPLALMLLVTIYILVERLLTIGKASRKNPGLVNSLKDMIHSGNIANARALCKSNNTPEATMLEQGISRIGQPIEEIREALNKSGAYEISKLEKGVGILNIMGRIAPMFGFIGTIFGVIKIFYDIALANTVEIGVISTGLYQKMISSSGGLVVGVIAFIGYHWVNSRLDKLAHRMENTQIEFLDMLNEPSK